MQSSKIQFTITMITCWNVRESERKWREREVRNNDYVLFLYYSAGNTKNLFSYF